MIWILLAQCARSGEISDESGNLNIISPAGDIYKNINKLAYVSYLKSQSLPFINP